MQKWLVPNKNGRGTVVDARTGPAEPATASTNVWDQHGLEVKRNAGAGNCGPLAVASALSSRWPEKYGDLTGVTVRAAVNAEMLDKPGKYAHSVAGCTFRHNNMTPNPGPIEIIDDAFKAYCAKKAKNGVDFDSVEMKAAAQVYPEMRDAVFLSSTIAYGNKPTATSLGQVQALPPREGVQDVRCGEHHQQRLFL